MDKVFVYRLGNSLYINLTNRCSNACEFCVRESETGIGGYDLWLEREPEASEVIEQIGDPKKYDEIVFCGYGEPTIRLDAVLEIAGWVKENGGRTRINTNGQANLIHGRDVTPEFEGKLDTVGVSLNASNAAAYQEICKSEFGEKAFDALLDFASKCKKYVPNVMLSIVDVLPPDEIERCKKVAEKVGVTLRIREMIE